MMTNLMLDVLYAACDRMWNNPDVNVPGTLWENMNTFFQMYANPVLKCDPRCECMGAGHARRTR